MRRSEHCYKGFGKAGKNSRRQRKQRKARITVRRQGAETGFVAYACDVGSTQKGNFGWARATPSEQSISGGNSIDDCVKSLRDDFGKKQTVTIGMECPLFIPIPGNSSELSLGRKGEGNRSTFAPAGGYVATLGLHQMAYILKKVWREGLIPVFDISKWRGDFRTVLFWEAFVSGNAHARPGKESHVKDAATAVYSFTKRWRLRNLRSDVSVSPPAEILSLVGCAILWAGWSDDLRLLRQSVLVVKPDEQYQGEIRTL